MHYIILLKKVKKMNDVILIEDLTCYGGCSALIDIPILNEFGISFSFIPSLILSKHTGNKDIVKIDFNDSFKKIYLDILNNTKALFIGYMPQNINFTIFNDFIGDIYYDPAMADDGRFYSGFNDDFVNKIKPLIRKAKIITPNLTEARLITKKENIDDIFKEFKKLGSNMVVITGIEENGKIGVVAECNNTRINYFHEMVKGKFYGTGDMFKSVLFSLLYQNEELEEAIKKASLYVLSKIKKI